MIKRLVEKYRHYLERNRISGTQVLVITVSGILAIVCFCLLEIK